MPSANAITPAQLARLVGTPDAPILIDVSMDEDFEADSRLIPTAFRHPHDEIESLIPQLEAKVVVICQKGLKLSQGAAAILRGHGAISEYLEGGNFAWRDAGLPRLPASRIPNHLGTGHTLWVTRHRPKVDRIACPWLIRRFIDPKAQFLFVAPNAVMGVAERFQATPFDIDDTHFSHRGSMCSFDAFIEEFELSNPALQRLAEIVRGADTARLDLAPQCAGFLAAALGLSRMYKDDLQQLEAAMPLMDAFYRWARDAVDETHDWQTGS